jgi:hypothetical protein
MAILNVIYLPGEGTAQLYQSNSPVNTFRVIFKAYFDADLDMLADESYFALWERPYAQINVTDRLNTSCGLP